MFNLNSVIYVFYIRTSPRNSNFTAENMGGGELFKTYVTIYLLQLILLYDAFEWCFSLQLPRNIGIRHVLI